MIVKQFYDEALSHLSYSIASDGCVALVDPARDPHPYLEFAAEHEGKIVGIFETHPHADFASSHLEFYDKYNANIYINPKVDPRYPFHAMSHNDEIKIGEITLKAFFTPGHSPDHNSYLILDENGDEAAIFTGDALFVGDVGRPDLREGTGNMHVGKQELAKMMFQSIHNIFRGFEDNVIVYPAHGPGSLCGKNMSSDLQSTIGREKRDNWAFQVSDEGDFVEQYLDGHTYIPKYFPFEVELNRTGAKPFKESIDKKLLNGATEISDRKGLLIDVRDEKEFKKGHIPGSINIQLENESSKFETWLGSIVAPEEDYYLVGSNSQECQLALVRAAKIGYEQYGNCILQDAAQQESQSDGLNIREFKENMGNFNIVDIRDESELDSDGKVFKNALHIPLHELRERTSEVPHHKPIVVHCAGGYRSAIGSSMLKAAFEETPVYDLGDYISQFQ